MTSDLTELARRLGRILEARGARLATAESCTGGLIAAVCTEIPGSSNWFECAFVTYMVDAKVRLLGVAPDTLVHHGAVSEPVARAMAVGALTHSTADFSVAVTGVAGPSGGDLRAPVGAVWFAWAAREAAGPALLEAARQHIPGERAEVRVQAVRIALEGLIRLAE